jgi:hypothetical protein
MDMMKQKCMNRNKISQKSPLSGLLMALLIVTGLTACGGGLSGDENETDPVVVDNPVAFIKRPLQFEENAPTDLAQSDIRDPSAFNPGAVLYLKDRATPTAAVRDISSAAFSDPSFLNEDGELLYDVKDLDVSYDGRKLLFAMRGRIEDADEEDQPTWNIWEYDVDARDLHRVIVSNFIAEQGHDIAPTYLPDGRILFSSTRQQRSKAILLDEGKSQYAAQSERADVDNFVLHVMNADGTDIQQLTFNQSHDLDPVVMSDGTIVFSRWDGAAGTANNGMNLYRINPDGTGLTYLYGRHSHVDGARRPQFTKPYEAENGNLVVQLREFLASPTEWQPTEVDFRNYVELNVRIVGTGNQGHFPVVNGMDVNSEGLSMSGVYGVAFPLYDGSGRYLTSWSPCLLVPVDAPEGTAPINCTQERIDTGNYEAAVPHFGLWIRDTRTDTQLPIEQESEGGIQYDEAVLMNSRELPASFVADPIDGEVSLLADDGFGILHIRSVYDFGNPGDAVPDGLPARYVRIEKPVSMPSNDVLNFDDSAFGVSDQGMKEILGYAPVESDGSVRVAVPANVAFAISVLNADGERVTGRHNNWLQVAPGETLECNGCHTSASTVPHGRPDAEPASIIRGSTLASLSDAISKLTPDLPVVGSGYADLSTLAPISPDCVPNNDVKSLCRIVINYTQHIHPLWSVDRGENTCTNCHTNSMLVDENEDGEFELVSRVPDAQLDLTDGPSTEEPNHFKSYRELLFGDNEQELNENGILVDRQVGSGIFDPVLVDGVPVLDENGDPVLVERLTTVPVQASMNPGARSSGRFLNRFGAGGSHEGYLSPAELKLIREWLDIGAQYYNNPFDPGVPVN